MKISAALPNVALSSALRRGPADSPACSVATLRTCAMPATARPATAKITTGETPAAAMRTAKTARAVIAANCWISLRDRPLGAGVLVAVMRAAA